MALQLIGPFCFICEAFTKPIFYAHIGNRCCRRWPINSRYGVERVIMNDENTESNYYSLVLAGVGLLYYGQNFLVYPSAFPPGARNGTHLPATACLVPLTVALFSNWIDPRSYTYDLRLCAGSYDMRIP